MFWNDGRLHLPIAAPCCHSQLRVAFVHSCFPHRRDARHSALTVRLKCIFLLADNTTGKLRNAEPVRPEVSGKVHGKPPYLSLLVSWEATWITTWSPVWGLERRSSCSAAGQILAQLRQESHSGHRATPQQDSLMPVPRR